MPADSVRDDDNAYIDYGLPQRAPSPSLLDNTDLPQSAFQGPSSSTPNLKGLKIKKQDVNVNIKKNDKKEDKNNNDENSDDDYEGEDPFDQSERPTSVPEPATTPPVPEPVHEETVGPIRIKHEVKVETVQLDSDDDDVSDVILEKIVKKKNSGKVAEVVRIVNGVAVTDIIDNDERTKKKTRSRKKRRRTVETSPNPTPTIPEAAKNSTQNDDIETINLDSDDDTSQHKQRRNQNSKKSNKESSSKESTSNEHTIAQSNANSASQSVPNTTSTSTSPTNINPTPSDKVKSSSSSTSIPNANITAGNIRNISLDMDRPNSQTYQIDVPIGDSKKISVTVQVNDTGVAGISSQMPPPERRPSTSTSTRTSPQREEVFCQTGKSIFNGDFGTDPPQGKDTGSGSSSPRERSKKHKKSSRRDSTSSSHRHRSQRDRSRSRHRSRSRSRSRSCHHRDRNNERRENNIRRRQSQNQHDNASVISQSALFTGLQQYVQLLKRCKICKVDFESRQKNTEHQRKKHTKKFCHVCCRLLKYTGNDWKDHMNRMHAAEGNGVELAKCPFCEQKHSYEGMYRHISKKHLEPYESTGVDPTQREDVHEDHQERRSQRNNTRPLIVDLFDDDSEGEESETPPPRLERMSPIDNSSENNRFKKPPPAPQIQKTNTGYTVTQSGPGLKSKFKSNSGPTNQTTEAPFHEKNVNGVGAPKDRVQQQQKHNQTANSESQRNSTSIPQRSPPFPTQKIASNQILSEPRESPRSQVPPKTAPHGYIPIPQRSPAHPQQQKYKPPPVTKHSSSSNSTMPIKPQDPHPSTSRFSNSSQPTVAASSANKSQEKEREITEADIRKFEGRRMGMHDVAKLNNYYLQNKTPEGKEIRKICLDLQLGFSSVMNWFNEKYRGECQKKAMKRK